jgi:hypothetical protein
MASVQVAVDVLIKQLQDNYGLYLTGEGVNKCVEEIKEDLAESTSSANAASAVSAAQIYHHAINRNIKGIGEAILPSKMLSLPRYMLQIVSARNLTQALMKQQGLLATIENEEKADSSVRDFSRMIGLVLTDGVSKITAIEFQHCNKLHLNQLFPGTKLLLHNNPGLNNQILLLAPHNFALITGRVEQLIQQHQFKLDAAETREINKSLGKSQESKDNPPPQFIPFDKSPFKLFAQQQLNQNNDKQAQQQGEIKSQDKENQLTQSQHRQQKGNKHQKHQNKAERQHNQQPRLQQSQHKPVERKHVEIGMESAHSRINSPDSAASAISQLHLSAPNPTPSTKPISIGALSNLIQSSNFDKSQSLALKIQSIQLKSGQNNDFSLQFSLSDGKEGLHSAQAAPLLFSRYFGLPFLLQKQLQIPAGKTVINKIEHDLQRKYQGTTVEMQIQLNGKGEFIVNDIENVDMSTTKLSPIPTSAVNESAHSATNSAYSQIEAQQAQGRQRHNRGGRGGGARGGHYKMQQ